MHSQLEVQQDSWTLSNNLQTEQENNMGKNRSLCRTLETCQYSGSYLDNRGTRINLKSRRNNIQFAYQVCNLAGLQN